MGRRSVCVLALSLCAVPLRAQEPPRGDGWVVLTLDAYRDLRARAFPAAAAPLPPPIDAALTRIDYTLRAGADTVTGDARLTVDVLKRGWVDVRVPAGLLVRSARLEGQPVALLQGNPPHVLISRPGRSVLTLDIVVPIAAAGGSESVTLPSSGSAVAAVSLSIPRAGVELVAGGGLILEHAETSAESRWVVYGTPAQPLTFTWKRRIEDRRAALPLRTRAEITQLISLGDDVSQITASVKTDVVQGSTRQAVLSIPDGVSVNHVSGATVADWRHQQNVLTVSFVEPVTTSTTFIVSAEARLPREGTIAVPMMRSPGAERETGGVGVDIAGAGEIGERQPRGLDAADPSDLGEMVARRASPSLVAFRLAPLKGDSPRALTVSVARYTPQAVLVANIDEARYESVVGEDGKTLVRARFAVRNNQRSFLAVTLPADATLWSAALASRPVRPGLSPQGRLLLPLQKGRAGEDAPVFAVELVYFQRTSMWNEEGIAQVELPTVDLPVSRTGFTLYHSPRYLVELRAGAFRAETDAGPWSLALRSTPVPVVTPEPAPALDATGLVPQRGSSAASSNARQDGYRSVAGVMPVDIELPSFGASLFAAAELTAENTTPVLVFEYRRSHKR